MWRLPEAFARWFHGAPPFPDFDALLADFPDWLAIEWSACSLRFEQRLATMRVEHPSPFEAVCTSGCVESGLTTQEGGARFPLFVVQILGLGTVIDSLYAVRRAVYEDGWLTLPELQRQVQEDFPDELLRRRLRSLPGRYGTDTAVTNDLAATVSRQVARLVLQCALADGIQPYPAFFNFLADVHGRFAATPDGRQAGERVSYGAGPSEAAGGRTPTTTAASVAHVAHDLCAAGAPLLLSMNRADIAGPAGRRRLRALIEGYFARGGSHLHLNLIDAETLRDAQEHPDRHADLLVRISGFSARFVALDRELQEALIARIQRGL